MLEISLWMDQIDKGREQERTILKKMWEQYELDYQSAQDICVPIEAIADTKKRIREIKREITDMGSVDVRAIEDYRVMSAGDDKP